ncbi:MAG: hypothetical protein NWR73_05135, partial [Flavobacteriales bacterium]|nr:hypothetical protein [Flavobacteriales bacterium]
MSKQKNTLKQTETKPEPPPVQEKKSKEKVKEKKSVIPAWTKDSRVKRIFAIVSTMISVYLFLACISFIFTGHHDLR